MPGVGVRMQPRVLIIGDRTAACDTIRVLVGTMGCQWVLASTMEQALALLNKERVSTVLLELPATISDPERMHQSLRELLVRFPGRVIALVDETPSPAISQIITKYSIPSVQRDRVTVDLWPRLESLIYPQLGIRRITQVARLVLDTFLQPLSVGLRFLRPDTRQMLYEAQSLTADISFECPPDSTRTTLLGQIMRTNEPAVPMNGASVVLKGQKGSLGLERTNESGEFSFEFQNEPRITLEMEVTPNEWVLIVSPALDWFEREEHQTVGDRGFEPFKINHSKPSRKVGR